MKKRTLNIIMAVSAGILSVAFLLPPPLAGYWHTPYSDCLCGSKSLLRFENGKLRHWSTAHNICNEVVGTYRQTDGFHYDVEYSRGEAREPVKFKIRPGWLFIKIVDDDDGYVWRGTREIRPWYIRFVLDHCHPDQRSTSDAAGKEN